MLDLSLVTHLMRRSGVQADHGCTRCYHPVAMIPGHKVVALFPELLGAGGIQEAGRLTAVAISQIASARGWSAEFLSLNDSKGNREFQWMEQSIRFRGFGRSKGRFILAAMASARKETRLVLALHPNLGPVASRMKWLQPRLHMALVLHGVEVWEPLPGHRRKAFLKADLFIAPSTYTLEQVVRIQGATRDKTRRIPWPLNPRFAEAAAKAETLPRPDGFPEGLVVMTAARLASTERYKGVDQLIRAIAQLAGRLPSLNLVVVGSGDDLPRHMRLASELGLGNRVRFFQGLSQEEVAAFLAHADIFALPSSGEGFGFVFLEAMAFGKPVIGAAAGGVTDIVEHEQNGLLVPPNDLVQLVQAIRRLAASDSLRLELGRNGAVMVRSKFSFEAFRSRLDDVLWNEPSSTPSVPRGPTTSGGEDRRAVR
jgi:phosphatidyl-myo-inositol dimannoside synthase